MTILLIFCSGISKESFGQAEQATYLQAKQYLNDGYYSMALEYFKKVSGDSHKSQPFYEYASYYFALAAYKNDQLGLARSMWLQQVAKSGQWDKIDEVHFALAQVYFDESNYEKGVFHAKASGMESAPGLIHLRLQEVESIDVLEGLQQTYSNDKVIGSVLAQKISEQPLSSRDFTILNQLVEKFDLQKETFGLPELGQSIHKSAYNIAVMLPFFFDGLDNSRKAERNNFVMELYEGILQAVDTLESSGQYLNIHTYDTKRNVEVTKELLSLQEMKSMDLIIGPLFPEPSALANEFSFENKINVINPLASNGASIANNPYSFLFKNDIETLARAAVQVAKDSIENKYVMVFYERNSKDSINAFTYARMVEEAGFEVLVNTGVVDTTLKMVYELFTEKYEIGYVEDQLDSVNALPGHLIKQRKSVITKDSVEYYEELFVFPKDSIGHVYVASSNALFASNFISAFSMRNDSTRLIGQGAWQGVETLTLDEMERLGIYFVNPKYLDKETETYRVFRNKFMTTYRKDPSYNAALGYEMMYYLGGMLKEYGHYFQKGNPTVGFRKGQLMEGINFGLRNSNQYVPITAIIDSKIVVVNPK